jgi:hypothetical protein
VRYDPDRGASARMSALLSDVTDGVVELDPDLRRELDQDLRFQAELVQYRKLMRALRSLRSDLADPGAELLDEIIAYLDEEAERHGLLGVLTPRRAAYFGGIAAATAAGVGTALVLARRRAA